MIKMEKLNSVSDLIGLISESKCGLVYGKNNALLYYSLLHFDIKYDMYYLLQRYQLKYDNGVEIQDSPEGYDFRLYNVAPWYMSEHVYAIVPDKYVAAVEDYIRDAVEHTNSISVL